jgi:hypothetical protein
MTLLDLHPDPGMVARLFLGGVFLFAGFAKLRSAHWAVLAVEAGTPRAVVAGLPVVEAMLGLGLLVSLGGGLLAWVAVALLIAFTVGVAHRYASGNRAPCNCFGDSSNDPVGKVTIVRNAVLVAIALLATR